MSLMVKIDGFLRRTHMPATRFGRLAVRDPRLVGDLRRGREPGPRMVARVEAFIAAHEHKELH
ncbi:MAG: hypothetical protein ACRCSO_09880 [Sphingomonas sp.]